jgi:hybrid cluster-associated redox disulfide protein
MSPKISKDMTFKDVLQMGPEVIQVFMKYKMGCVGCAAAKFESIEQGAKAHGIDVDALIRDLNVAVEKQ